jgi:D-alanyl-lipoteichoic acid acyltransferase DltB (MBOAT superfamily)
VLIVASYLYALQLYFDFSGYTDMARGAARLFGIELTRNFNRPYLATSIADFWRRWHISFSRWILDYIFKPLQMRFRDRGSAGTAAALLITFLVSGIWHGAEWGYVVWGLLHGCYLAFSVLYQPFRKKAQAWIGLTDGPILKVWQTAVTFNLVCFSFIFFRAPSLPDAWHVITHASFGNVSQVASLLIQRGFSELFITVVMLLALLMTGAFRNFADELVMRVQSSHIAWRWTCYYLVLLVIMTVGIFDDQSFIYYRF